MVGGVGNGLLEERLISNVDGLILSLVFSVPPFVGRVGEKSSKDTVWGPRGKRAFPCLDFGGGGFFIGLSALGLAESAASGGSCTTVLSGSPVTFSKREYRDIEDVSVLLVLSEGCAPLQPIVVSVVGWTVFPVKSKLLNELTSIALETLLVLRSWAKLPD
jgi:hypothetical protein